VINRVFQNDMLKIVTITQSNDQYAQFDARSDYPTLNELFVSIQCPVTQKDIDKASACELFLIRETAEQFNTITSPYINGIDPKKNAWIDNIIDHKPTTEEILYEHVDQEHGFFIHPGYRWDKMNVKICELLVIVSRRDIRCLRDLRAKHIPLLEIITRKTLEVANEKFGVRGNQLRAYVHYFPSFFHFHVHFYHVNIQSNKIPLDDIIDNLKMDGEYYAKANLTAVVDATSDLYKKLTGNNA